MNRCQSSSQNTETHKTSSPRFVATLSFIHEDSRTASTFLGGDLPAALDREDLVEFRICVWNQSSVLGTPESDAAC